MRRCLIVMNTFKKDASELGREIGSFLEEKGIGVRSFSYDGQSAFGREVNTSFLDVDFVITLGGDGTVLFASRGCGPLGLPVFAVNLGEFGFLAGVQKSEWKEKLELFIEEKLPCSERHLVTAEVFRGEKSVFMATGLNDATVSSTAASRLINLDVSYDGAFLGPFKANGLIVSTATGSTAYSAGAGGPIISPTLKALVLTPISSFSLSARPIVFSADGKLEIRVLESRTDVGLTVDGQIDFALLKDDRVELSIPPYAVKLAGYTLEKFYAALQSKLNWAGGPRA